MSIVLAIGSALTFGFADFSGGLASRRVDPLAVTAGAALVGLAASPILLAVVQAPFSPRAIVVGFAAGLFGGAGLALYFTALRDGAMGVVSPLSAVSAAGLPIGIGVIGGERPELLALLGIALALPAIYLAARPAPAVAHTMEADVHGPVPGSARLPPGVALGIASGLAFGMFFVLLDAAPDDGGAWPLLGAKLGSATLTLAAIAVTRGNLRAVRPVLPYVVASGVLDLTANLLFLLALRDSLLSIISVISSQYPVVVVLLSVAVLRDRLLGSQWVGIGLALTAVALISLS